MFCDISTNVWLYYREYNIPRILHVPRAPSLRSYISVFVDSSASIARHALIIKFVLKASRVIQITKWQEVNQRRI